MSAQSTWWGPQGGVPMEDQTRPIAPVAKEDPTGLGDINWPKAFVIVGVTAILVIGVVTIVALLTLPPEFWMMPQ